MNLVISELKNFSKENWWVFPIFIFALWFVYFTWSWNLIEIILLFLFNFVWNLFIMLMQANYTNKNNTIWALCHLGATATFTSVSLYGFIVLDQSQYILWQICYILTTIKSVSFYKFNKDFKFLNEKLLIFVNILVFAAFLKFMPYELYSILQGLGFSAVTIWLVSTSDKLRYYLSLLWVVWITSGSLIGVINSYISGSIDGIALGYFILTLTVFVFYLKLLPNYIKKITPSH